MGSFYDTYQLIVAAKELDPAHSFLRDRYFPTNDATDIFLSEKVLVEFEDGPSRKLAPFVAPRKGNVTILREGAYMDEYEPSFIAPSKTLTIDSVKKRGYGEALYTQLTPAERAEHMTLNDIEKLDKMITRREEWMCAQVLFTNGCIMKHVVDDRAVETMEVRYYNGDLNPAVYTPPVSWDNPDADIISDLYNIATMLKNRGLRATDVIMPPGVDDYVMNNNKIQKLLDNRRANVGELDSVEIAPSVVSTMKLNAKGHKLELFTNSETYTDDDGKTKDYIPEGEICVTAPECGKMLYGSITQIEADDLPHDFAGRRVPKYIVDKEHNTRKVVLSAAPLPVVRNKNCAISAKVLF